MIVIPLTACVMGLHMLTYHVDIHAGFSNHNPGVYVNCDGFTAGHYRNSERSQSDYVGYTFKTGPIDWTAGVITGYKRGTTPMLLPSMKVTKHFRLAVVPPIPGTNVNTAGFHLMYEF